MRYPFIIDFFSNLNWFTLPVVILGIATDNGLAEMRDSNARFPVDFAPFVQPFVKLFDSYSLDAAANVLTVNDTKISNTTKAASTSTISPVSMFDAETLIRRILGVTTTTTTTTTPPAPSELLMQTIFEPIIDSIEKEIRKAKTPAVLATMTRDGVKTFVKKTPNTLFDYDSTNAVNRQTIKKTSMNGNVDFPRRSPPAPSLRNSALMRKMMATEAEALAEKDILSASRLGEEVVSTNPINIPLESQQRIESEPSPLTSLLRFMGVDSRPRTNELQVGQDRSVSVLGMPVGRRNGLELSPLAGVSLGNQDMFGPVAVNDRYNVKWDFLDHIFDTRRHRH